MKYLVTTFLALLAVLTGLAESSAAMFLVPKQSGGGEIDPYLGLNAVRIVLTDDLTYSINQIKVNSSAVTIDWGDGQTSSSSSSASHTYASEGTYTIVISGSPKSWGVRTTSGSTSSTAEYKTLIIWLADDFDFPVGQDSDYAFRNLGALTEVRKRNSLNWLGRAGVFQYNSALTSLRFALGVTVIGSDCFNGCTLINEDLTFSSLLTIGATAFYQFGAGGNINMPVCSTINGNAFRFSKFNTVNAPNCNTVTGGNVFRNMRNCSKLTLGHITSFSDTTLFSEMGADCESIGGIKAVIEFNSTVAEIRAISRFPSEAPTTTKFVCTDGYIVYENGAWTNHLN